MVETRCCPLQTRKTNFYLHVFLMVTSDQKSGFHIWFFFLWYGGNYIESSFYRDQRDLSYSSSYFSLHLVWNNNTVLNVFNGSYLLPCLKNSSYGGVAGFLWSSMYNRHEAWKMCLSINLCEPMVYFSENMPPRDSRSISRKLKIYG